jgi:hypothetical protein
MPTTVTATVSAQAIGAQVGAVIRQARSAPPEPRINYPRPPLTALHADLFREPVYEDGQAYADPDDEDEDA